MTAVLRALLWCRVGDDWKFLCCMHQEEEQLAEKIHRQTYELLLRRKTRKHPEKTPWRAKGRSRFKDSLRYLRYKVFVLIYIQRKRAFHVIFIKLQFFYCSIVGNDKYLGYLVCLDIIIMVVTHSYNHHWFGMSSEREIWSKCLINFNHHIFQVIAILYLILLYLLTFYQCLTSAHFAGGVWNIFNIWNA